MSLAGKPPPRRKKKGAADDEVAEEVSSVEDTAMAIYLLCGSIAFWFLWRQFSTSKIELRELSYAQLSVMGGCCALLCALFMFAVPFLRRYGGNAPYLATSEAALEVVLKLCQDISKKNPNAKLVDLGSGNGQLVVEVAKQCGLQCEGYELNWILVVASRLRAWAARPNAPATFHWRNMYEAPLQKFDIVFVFGVPEIMKKLEKKFDAELQPNALVCSNQFKLPGWTPVQEEAGVLVYHRD